MYIKKFFAIFVLVFFAGPVLANDLYFGKYYPNFSDQTGKKFPIEYRITVRVNTNAIPTDQWEDKLGLDVDRHAKAYAASILKGTQRSFRPINEKELKIFVVDKLMEYGLERDSFEVTNYQIF